MAYYDKNGVEFTEDRKTLVRCPSKLSGNYSVPNEVTHIGEEAFYGCCELKSITIPDNVTHIGDYAFAHCSGLERITIPDSVTHIGKYAFAYCSGLKRITIPNNVADIGHLAFTRCSSLVSVIWDAKECTTVESGIFDEESIVSFSIGDSVKRIPDFLCMEMSNLTSIIIPNSVTSIGDGAFGECRGLERIIVNSGNPVFDSRDNCNAIIETSTNKLLIGCKNTIIPNNVTSIGEEAFSSCCELKSITIPNSVTSIGDFAFQRCSGLTSITLPNSVTIIGSYAFDDCSGLKEVTIGNSVKEIGESAFDECSSLMSIIIPDRDDIEKIVKRVVGDKIKIIRSNSQEPHHSANIENVHMIECPKCKKMCIIPIDALFCPECGTKL